MTDCVVCRRPSTEAGCCVLCPTLNPNRRQHVDEPQGCPTCRVKLAAIPTDIADAYPLLRALREPQRGTPGRGKSAEAPIPIAVDPYDLRAHHTTPNGPIRLARLRTNLADQIGYIPVLAKLKMWVRELADVRGQGEGRHLDAPDWSVYDTCRWLTERTDWAVDHYPGVDSYAAELDELRGTLLALVGRTEPDTRPQRIPGVPCVRCHYVTLIRRHDGSVECLWPDCRTVWRADEYERLTKAAAKAATRVSAS